MHPHEFDVGLDESSMQLLRRRIIAGETLTFETRHRRKDGTVFPVEIRAGRFEQEGRHRHLSLVHDITERKRAEQRLIAQHTRHTDFGGGSDSRRSHAEDPAGRVRVPGMGPGRAVAHRPRGGRPTLRADVAQSIRRGPAIRGRQPGEHVPAGIGLPGRVWASRAPACIPDVVHDPIFLRARIAAREGLHAAFGFPILLGGEVLGVIEFFSHEIRQPDQDLLNMMATLGSQIGQFIERKRAEERCARRRRSWRT